MRTKPLSLFVLFLIVFLLPKPATAQQTDPSQLTIDRIFLNHEFSPKRFGPAKWLEDGSGYTMLQPSEQFEGAKDIVRYDPVTGEEQVLVAAAALVPEGVSEPLSISDYSWSPDGTKLLVFTNTRRVWRYHTRGDYWVLDLSSRELQRLGKDFEQTYLMFAKFDPTGEHVAYVYKNNIYVEKIAGGAITQLTHDGSETIINGTFDWVYEEEFKVDDGFRWSPDGRSIAFWQLDAEGIGVFNLVNYTDSIYSKIIPVQYPKVGTTNSAAELGVIDVGSGKITWMDIPGDPRENYIPRMDWAASSEEIVFQRMNRKQNNNKVMYGNIETGDTRVILEETDDAWIDVDDNLKFTEDGEYFTWMSERSGWRHLYLVSRDGSEMTDLTPGEYDVIEVSMIDTENERVYFIASPDEPYRQYLYMTTFDGEVSRVTPDKPGWHEYTISNDGNFAFHTYSTMDIPTVTNLVSLPEHEELKALLDNKAVRLRTVEVETNPAEFFTIDIGEVALDAWRILPPDFDPEKKYPVLFYVYGEPAGQTVEDKYSSTVMWFQYLAQQGYIVMSVDNRGTPAPRGREFRKSVYLQIGILASADQAAAVESLIEEYPYIDADRIAIWGWSGGGSMSLNAIFRYPELYSTAMSVAPVPAQWLYDTIYQERYMDTPENNPEGFEQGSPITFASQLEGNLLLVHGTGDDNVHYQGTELLINELIKHNKQFTMMAYPNRGHSIYEGENTRRHLFTLLTEYLMEHVPAGPRE